jgi:hypothetical protein
MARKTPETTMWMCVPSTRCTEIHRTPASNYVFAAAIDATLTSVAELSAFCYWRRKLREKLGMDDGALVRPDRRADVAVHPGLHHGLACDGDREVSAHRPCELVKSDG